MQSWRFLRIRRPDLRRSHQLVEEERIRTAQILDVREQEFMRLKVEGILQAAEIPVVAMPPGRKKYVFDRRTLLEMDLASAACAIQNLWLAARAEGLGISWVSILEPRDLAALLQMPTGAHPVAVLCLEPVDRYDAQPMLEQEQWARRAPLEAMIMTDVWQEQSGPTDEPSCSFSPRCSPRSQGE